MEIYHEDFSSEDLFIEDFSFENLRIFLKIYSF